MSVRGHALWLQEMLSNLVDNALQYTPEGGIVTIRCGVLAQQHPSPKSAAGKTLLPSRATPTDTVYRAFLEVEDNGPGIEATARAQVLERFVRLPGTKVEGTGLGLPIAREIAVRHRSELVLVDGIAHENGSGCGLRASVLFATDFLLTFSVQDVVPDTASQPAEEAEGPG